MSIDITSKGAKQSQSFIDSVKFINHALKTANEFTKDRREHIASLNKTIKQVKDRITKVKQGWIRYLESIERTLLENVQRQKDKVVANVQEEMLETKLIEEHIIKQKDTFEFVEKHGSDKQAFLLAQTLKTELSDIEQKIATLTEKAKYSTFKFETIEPCDTMKSIGSISIVENPCEITFVPVKIFQSQIPVVGRHLMSSFIHDCDIDIKSQHGQVNIDGITVIYNDMIVLCDLRNSRLLVYSDSNQYQYQIKTKHKPSDIATIPSTNKVVVSSDNSDNIQFIDVVRKKVYNERHISGSKYGGVAVSDTNLFIGDKGSIHVLDHQGDPVRKIKTKPEDGTPWRITICSSGNICYSKDVSLYCIKPDGEEVFTYNSPDLRGAWGITTDNHDNVYIVGQDSNNIHRLRPDGTFIDIILKDKDNIEDPRTCCFNRNYRKLYVVNKFGRVISVFNVV
jgi:sugar lactone lactonase YvrE